MSPPPDPPARPRLSSSWLVVCATLLFATMGVCVKLASAEYPAGELVFYRSLTGALMMLERGLSDLQRLLERPQIR